MHGIPPGRVPRRGSPETTHSAAILTAHGGREWVTFDDLDLDLDEDDFEEIGTHLSSLGAVATGKVGEADSHLFDLRTGVETARAWRSEHRRPDPGAGEGAMAAS